MALPRDGWWRERSEGELILGGCSYFTLKPEAWLSLWARVSISGEEASEATSLPFILLQSEIPVAKAKRALGQVQEEHSCEACLRHFGLRFYAYNPLAGTGCCGPGCPWRGGPPWPWEAGRGLTRG